MKKLEFIQPQAFKFWSAVTPGRMPTKLKTRWAQGKEFRAIRANGKADPTPRFKSIIIPYVNPASKSWKGSKKNILSSIFGG
jgi:hypothetical protein